MKSKIKKAEKAEKKVKSFVIDRKRWLRGGKNGAGRLADSRLRSKSGQMCCLGFYLEACGAKSLTNVATPEECKRGLPGQAKWLYSPTW